MFDGIHPNLDDLVAMFAKVSAALPGSRSFEKFLGVAVVPTPRPQDHSWEYEPCSRCQRSRVVTPPPVCKSGRTSPSPLPTLVTSARGALADPSWGLLFSTPAALRVQFSMA